MSAIVDARPKSPSDRFANFLDPSAPAANPILTDALSLRANDHRNRPGIGQGHTTRSSSDSRSAEPSAVLLAGLPQISDLERQPEPFGDWSLAGDAEAAEKGHNIGASLNAVFAYAAAGSAQRLSALFVALGFPTASGSLVLPDDPKEHAWAANEQHCLAEAIYFEARGEPVPGQLAVAQVVINRVNSPAYPDTVCGVVYQNETMRNRCQFSFACDGIPERTSNRRAWAKAQSLAEDVLRGSAGMPELGHATHFHATHVEPHWARSMKQVKRIGLHIFYGA